MRATTAYFAGVGTVAVAIAAGLGGGLLFANIVAPHEPKYAAEPTKLEQRMAARSISVTSAPSEPVPYRATAPPVEQQANNAAATQPAASTPPPAPTEQTAREPATSPREAFAKARDADVKRAVAGKRRAERHQQWADQRRDRQPRGQDLEAVKQSVRDITEPRQAFMAEPARLDVPRNIPGIKLFGDE